MDKFNNEINDNNDIEKDDGIFKVSEAEQKKTNRRNNRFFMFIFGAMAGILIAIGFHSLSGVVGDIKYTIATQKYGPSLSANSDAKALPDDIFDKKVDLIKKIISDQFIFDYNKGKMQDGMLKGLVASLDDPYSQYFTPAEFKALMEQMSGKYSGIGVAIAPYKNTSFLKVEKVYENSPAAKAKLKEGDIIKEVDGVKIKPSDTVDDVISKIRGKKGTYVTLGVSRGKSNELLKVKVMRDDIVQKSAYSTMFPDKIGYIGIVEFLSNTPQDFEQEYNKLKKEGMKKLIIDLRNNPGGSFDAVCRLLDDFLSDGVIVYTRDKNGKEEYVYADPKVKYDIPLIVLVNGNSASASEIFAGVVKDRELGKLVGEKTFGKGIVQNTIPLTDGSAVKLTISRYFTPKGYVINKHGIRPDVTVTLKEPPKKKKYTYKDDNQLMRAIKEIEKMNK